MSLLLHATDTAIAFDVKMAVADGRRAHKVKLPASSMQTLHQYVDTAQGLMVHAPYVEVVTFSLPVNFEYSILIGPEGADDYHLAQIDRYDKLVAHFKPIGALAARRPANGEEPAHVALHLVFWDIDFGIEVSTLDLLKSRFSF